MADRLSSAVCLRLGSYGQKSKEVANIVSSWSIFMIVQHHFDASVHVGERKRQSNYFINWNDGTLWLS